MSKDLPSVWTTEVKNDWGIAGVISARLTHLCANLVPFPPQSLSVSSGAGAVPDNLPRQRGLSSLNYWPPFTVTTLLRGKPVGEIFNISQ